MEINRLKAFNDGILAIIIAITVLKLKELATKNLNDFKELSPVLFAYIFSFMFIAIFWVNHHFLIKKSKAINVKTLWCNIAWLSITFFIPFTTSWVCRYPNSFAILSVYFLNITLSYIVFQITFFLISHENGDEVKPGVRSIVSLIAYAGATLFGGFYPIAAFIVVAIVSCLWIFIKKKKQNK